MSADVETLGGGVPTVVSRMSEDFLRPKKTMHETGALHSTALLSLILDPNLEERLTPAAILATDNLALFQLMPLLLAAVQRIGEILTKRQAFTKLVSTLRRRVVACRGLKLRFLLLVRNPAFASHWDVRMVHRRQCYVIARQYLANLAKNENYRMESNESVQLASTLSESTDIKLGSGVPLGTDSLVAFCARSLLHPTHGIHTRSIMFRLRNIKSAFYASELIDGIMERSTFHSRDEAVNVAQRLLDLGVIHKVATTSHRFRDNQKSVYQCSFAMHRDDDGHCRVTTNDGYELTSWDAVDEANAKQIKQISVQVPMDMIDLQSYEFWTATVYAQHIEKVEKGYRYGYRAITHPLYCAGLNPRDNLDFSSVRGKVQENQSDDSEPDDVSHNSSVVSSRDINDLHQEAAVVGSVIVRKVFSSIARPMIVQLRVPLENADLDDDDHHVVLAPGILVKEGDNLMQDLGVETMFQCFNYIWSQSHELIKKHGMAPISLSYEVFPTSTTQGFMEAVTGLTSLKDYDWKMWRDKYGSDKHRVKEMLRSAAGAYIGAYVVGGRDRHFDNVLIKDDLHLLHIDFGFLLGTSPPIDGPPIAIAPQMELVFRELHIWKLFGDLFVDTFMALRAYAPAIVRTSVLIFSKAGYEDEQIRHYLQGKFSLNVHESDKTASEFVHRQLNVSSGDIKTKFKQFAHEHIDPAWYGLLEKGFPPAVAIMKLVDAKEQRAARKLAESINVSEAIDDDEKIHIQE